MNNQLKIYSYTSDRLSEFNKEKKENDIIIPALVLNDKEEVKKLTDDKNIFFDISHLYKSVQETNSISVEAILYQISQNENWHIIINYNLLTRFKADFGQYIDEIIPINNIYKSEVKVLSNFSNFSNEEIQELESNLNNNLYGHEQFKKDLIQQIKNYSILYNLSELKIMSILICGDSGVGKTEVARIIHETFFKDSKMIKINLGNYNTEGALNSLIGSPKGYIGSERGGELSNKIKNSDSKIILIDEFEKADNDIFNFFYELLEDGKFTDLNENEYNLNGYLIIFTTNLNKENYKTVIPAPLLSRFTMKSLFEPISYEMKNKYINDKCKKLINIYNSKYNQTIDYKNVIKKIDKEMIKSINNFRYLNRVIQDALIKVVEEENSTQDTKK